MFWNNLKYILYLFLLISFLSFAAAFLVTTKVYYPHVLKPMDLQPEKVAAEEKISEKLVIKRFHTICGHFEELDPKTLTVNIADTNNIGVEELIREFPPEDGWILDFVEGKWIATQITDTLCVADRLKRHLRVVDEYIAVYQGPPTYKENLLFITEISIWDIPEKWREAILSGETFFNNEKELLQALDSLDEFRMSF
ncbi:hypothetical protein [Desulfitibacter alkalitolerans]|uniref:hypothetical protein n=1 Tax=Desulfitibacter alkalitolerans TaxID=264641 RepID=UPI0004853131|nr:hypothetical protein [Desulfitibacter alkalitolerans]